MSFEQPGRSELIFVHSNGCVVYFCPTDLLIPIFHRETFLFSPILRILLLLDLTYGQRKGLEEAAFVLLPALTQRRQEGQKRLSRRNLRGGMETARRDRRFIGKGCGESRLVHISVLRRGFCRQGAKTALLPWPD